MSDWIKVKDKLPELKKGIGQIANNSGLLQVKDNNEIAYGAYFENGNWLDICFILCSNKCKYENGLLNNVTDWRVMTKEEIDLFLEPFINIIPKQYRDRSFLIEEK